MRTKEVKIDDVVYTIKEIGTDEEIAIRDKAYEVELPKSPKDRIRPRLLLGTLQIEMIIAGLEDWTIKDSSGNKVPIKDAFGNKIRENIIKFLPKGHMDILFTEIDEFNRMTEGEKKI